MAGMTPDDLRTRTKQFGVDAIRFARQLPQGRIAQHIGGQLVDAATSVGANYRAVCRARSRADFIAKLGIVIEEADETAYWLELLVDAGLTQDLQAKPLRDEAHELIRIFVRSRQTARNRHARDNR